MGSGWALLVAGLLLVGAAQPARAFDWKECTGSEAGLFKVSYVDMNPEPVPPGSLATFLITADASTEVSGGTVQMVVHYAGMPIWTQVDNLCDKATCPIKAGTTQIRYSQLFPSITPPGSYTLTLNGHSGDKALFCVNVDFQVVPPGVEEESGAALAGGLKGGAGQQQMLRAHRKEAAA